MPTLLWSVRIITVADKCSLCLIVKTWAWPTKNKTEPKTHQIREDIEPQEAKVTQLDRYLLKIKYFLMIFPYLGIRTGASLCKMHCHESSSVPCLPGIGVHSICGTWYIRPDTACPGFSLQLCRRVQWVASGQ